MSNALPPSDQFELVLSKTEGTCPPVLKDAMCCFSYNWDFQKNMGLAHLLTVDGTPVNITLHPLGLQGKLAFMSDMEPTPYEVNGVDVVIYRVSLELDPTTGERFAGVMFNNDGSCVETTQNWSAERSAGMALA